MVRLILQQLQKYCADGSMDLTYGHNGLSVAIPIYESHAAIQSDGKIIIAGVTWNAESLVLVVCRRRTLAQIWQLHALM